MLSYIYLANSFVLISKKFYYYSSLLIDVFTVDISEFETPGGESKKCESSQSTNICLTKQIYKIQ
jgi:hypothetical protein